MDGLLTSPPPAGLEPETELAAARERPWRAARLAVSALFLINGALFANWVSRIPAVQMEHGLSHGALGAALLALGLGALVTMPVAGWSAARHGSDRVSRWSALACCALLPMPAFAPNTWTLVLALFGFGAAHGALDVAMNAQAVEVERRYGRAIMSSFHALFSLGGLGGAVIGGGLAAAGVKLTVHFSVVAALLAGATVLLVFPRLLPSRPAPERRPAPSRAIRVRPPGVVLVLGVIAFCSMLGEGAMADWSAIFLRNAAGAGEGVAAAGYAAFSIAMAAGRLAGDRLAMRFGPVTLVRCSGGIAAAGLMLALFARQPAVTLLGFAAVGAGLATVVPQVFSAAGRQGETGAALAVAQVTTLGYLGFLVGPPMIGFAAELFGLPSALGIVVVTSLFLIVLAGGVGHRTTAHSSTVAPFRRPTATLPRAAVQEPI